MNFVDTNITGTFNMLEAARKFWQATRRTDRFRFQIISTDEVFGLLPADTAVQCTEATEYNQRYTIDTTRIRTEVF